MPRRTRTPEEAEELRLRILQMTRDNQARGDGIEVAPPMDDDLIDEFVAEQDDIGEDIVLEVFPFLGNKKNITKPRFRTHIILPDGYKIHQPGKNKDKMSWQKFLKKLLLGRPLGKEKTIRQYSDMIAGINSSDANRALIKMIKSHGNKFDYALELQRAYNKLYKVENKKRMYFGGETTRRRFNTGTTLTGF